MVSRAWDAIRNTMLSGGISGVQAPSGGPPTNNGGQLIQFNKHFPACPSVLDPGRWQHVSQVQGGLWPH